MNIQAVKITNFRNFQSALIRFNGDTLVVGANDVGKTNLLYAIRFLLDRSIPETELEPQESDFHIDKDGNHADDFTITVLLGDITQDAVISKLKGCLSDKGQCLLRLAATRSDLSVRLYIGHKREALEEIDSRFYLKHIHFKYVESTRDLGGFIRRERRNLLKFAKDNRDDYKRNQDAETEDGIRGDLDSVNKKIAELTYVDEATSLLNAELSNLSHHNTGFSVGLRTRDLDFTKFLDQLDLGASTNGVKIGLGGDGRNNQILLALWKAKSEIEHDLLDEAVVYCIEEPEAHLHPHQQRKLAAYLCEKLKGQVITSTHSPHIASEFPPNSIVRLLERSGQTRAAGDGCSPKLADAWDDMGYRMSVIPAEAFFSDGVLLVEGPSEELFYRALAAEINIDIDFLNLCIMPVNGVDFDVYIKILDALEIPWAMRTDNDVTKVQRSNPPKYRFSGLNRALKIAGEAVYENHDTIDHPSRLKEEHEEESKVLNPKGIFVSKIDLEHDLVEALLDETLEYSKADNAEDAVTYFQQRKAIRMGEFLREYKEDLSKLADDALAAPLKYIEDISSQRRG